MGATSFAKVAVREGGLCAPVAGPSRHAATEAIASRLITPSAADYRARRMSGMQRTLLGLLAAIVTLAQATSMSQSLPNAATDISRAHIETVLKMAQTDQQLKVVDLGKYNVGVGVLHRGA